MGPAKGSLNILAIYQVSERLLVAEADINLSGKTKSSAIKKGK